MHNRKATGFVARLICAGGFSLNGLLFSGKMRIVGNVIIYMGFCMRLPVIRHIFARPRMAIAVLLGIALSYALPEQWRHTTRLLTAWDCATGFYLVCIAWMMWCSTTEHMRRRAIEQDESRIVALLLTVTAAVASLAAIVAELSTAKAAGGHLEASHIALGGVTVMLSWAFMQTMFALHYAHEYYIGRGGIIAKGLDFPGGKETPDYWDFVYYAFVIGTSTATADVNISSSIMRRTTTLHCVVAFFFNTTILALTINISAGLF
jgi:uncharacterized membrane protein